jgi:hypothetical protein
MNAISPLAAAATYPTSRRARAGSERLPQKGRADEFQWLGSPLRLCLPRNEEYRFARRFEFPRAVAEQAQGDRNSTGFAGKSFVSARTDSAHRLSLKPFQGGLVPATGSSQGLLTGVGTAVSGPALGR